MAAHERFFHAYFTERAKAQAKIDEKLERRKRAEKGADKGAGGGGDQRDAAGSSARGESTAGEEVPRRDGGERGVLVG